MIPELHPVHRMAGRQALPSEGRAPIVCHGARGTARLNAQVRNRRWKEPEKRMGPGLSRSRRINLPPFAPSRGEVGPPVGGESLKGVSTKKLRGVPQRWVWRWWQIRTRPPPWTDRAQAGWATAKCAHRPADIARVSADARRRDWLGP